MFVQISIQPQGTVPPDPYSPVQTSSGSSRDTVPLFVPRPTRVLDHRAPRVLLRRRRSTSTPSPTRPLSPRYLTEPPHPRPPVHVPSYLHPPPSLLVVRMDTTRVDPVSSDPPTWGHYVSPCLPKVPAGTLIRTPRTLTRISIDTVHTRAHTRTSLPILLLLFLSMVNAPGRYTECLWSFIPNVSRSVFRSVCHPCVICTNNDDSNGSNRRVTQEYCRVIHPYS